MKKYLSVLLALVLMLCLSACGGDSNGDKTEESKGEQESSATLTTTVPTTAPTSIADVYEWQEISGGIEITKYLGSDTKIVIPSVIENKAVVSVGTTFSGNIVLEELELPDTVTKADLSNCKALKRLTAHGLTTLSRSTCNLTGCTVLECLALPKVSSIVYFEFPEALKELVIPAVQYCRSYDYPKTLEKLDISGAIEITWSSQFENLKEVVINENLKWHGPYTEKSETNPLNNIQQAEPNDYYDGVRVYYYEITEQNKAQVYCELFKCNEIVVNGVKYTYPV